MPGRRLATMLKRCPGKRRPWRLCRRRPRSAGRDIGGWSPGWSGAGAGRKKTHEDKGNARSEREPPGRQADRRSELRRADGGTAAYHGAGQAPGQHGRSGGAASQSVSLGCADRPGCVNAPADDQENRHQQQGELQRCNRQLHTGLRKRESGIRQDRDGGNTSGITIFNHCNYIPEI